jgi:hypothetical protein
MKLSALPVQGRLCGDAAKNPGTTALDRPAGGSLTDTRQGTLRDQRARLTAGQWHIRWIFRQDYGNPKTWLGYLASTARGIRFAPFC